MKESEATMENTDMDIESSQENSHQRLKKGLVDEPSRADLSPLQKRSFIFIILFLALFSARIGQGIIPAITTNLAEYFSMKSVAIGSLGSMVYFGCTIGKFN